MGFMNEDVPRLILLTETSKVHINQQNATTTYLNRWSVPLVYFNRPRLFSSKKGIHASEWYTCMHYLLT